MISAEINKRNFVLSFDSLTDRASTGAAHPKLARFFIPRQV